MEMVEANGIRSNLATSEHILYIKIHIQKTALSRFTYNTKNRINRTLHTACDPSAMVLLNVRRLSVCV